MQVQKGCNFLGCKLSTYLVNLHLCNIQYVKWMSSRTNNFFSVHTDMLPLFCCVPRQPHHRFICFFTCFFVIRKNQRAYRYAFNRLAYFFAVFVEVFLKCSFLLKVSMSHIFIFQSQHSRQIFHLHRKGYHQKVIALKRCSKSLIDYILLDA